MLNMTFPSSVATSERVRITTSQQAVALNLYFYIVSQGGAGYIKDVSKDEWKEIAASRDADELTAVQLLTDDFKVLIDEDGIDPFINPLTGTRENMPESYGDNTRAALEATFGVTI